MGEVNVKNIVIIFIAALLAAGCSVNPFKTAKLNVENSKKLRIGMTKAEVLSIMGEPAKDEAFHRPDIWFYYFNTNWADGFVTEDECFPLVFENGKLAGWGNAYYTRSRIEHKNRVPNVELPGKNQPAQGK